MDTEALDARINSLGILPALKEGGSVFRSRMHRFVYAGLDGTDHTRLLYYFSLLDGAAAGGGGGEDVGEIGGMSPQTHIKLLKKIKASAPGK